MSTIKVDELLAADGTLTTEVSIPSLDTRFCTAWVNFNGVGTVAIRDSYNVSSITDLGNGLYVLNYATPLANVNYSISYATDSQNFNTGAGLSIYNLLNISSQFTTSVTISTYSYTGSINTVISQDTRGVFIQIFGGQA